MANQSVTEELLDKFDEALEKHAKKFPYVTNMYAWKYGYYREMLSKGNFNPKTIQERIESFNNV